MSSATLIQIGVFLGLNALIGVITWLHCRKADRSGNEAKEYFLAGSGLSWVFIAGSLTLTNISTDTLVGWNGNQMLLVLCWGLAGVTILNADERTALDQLVADDLAFARRENLTDLGGTFVARRTEADRQQAGLDRLAPEQLAKLNELVAAALSARPTPKERPRLKESDVLGAKRRGEIHVSVTVAYGWGRGGREYRAGSLWLDYQDPDGRFGLGLGISTSEGEGFFGHYPGDYYPGGDFPGFYAGYPDRRYHMGPRMYLDTSYPAESRDEFFRGDGACLHGPFSGSFGRPGFRKH